MRCKAATPVVDERDTGHGHVDYHGHGTSLWRPKLNLAEDDMAYAFSRQPLRQGYERLGHPENSGSVVRTFR
jgi:hypothetical protein